MHQGARNHVRTYLFGLVSTFGDVPTCDNIGLQLLPGPWALGGPIWAIGMSIERVVQWYHCTGTVD